MVDQASNLRKLMLNSKSNKQKLKAKVISVTSGKGGVGKTNFSINFAISLRKLGYEVLVFDGDIGLANAEIISGTIVEDTITDLLTNKIKDIFSIIDEGPRGIKMISGGSGLEDLSLLNENATLEIIDQLEKLEVYFDFIIIDTGAGISNLVIDFLMASDEVIFIVTPDPTSLTDSYALLKALVKIGYKGKVRVVMNMVDNRKEALETFKKLEKVSKKFLTINIELLGYLKRSNIVSKAIKAQSPFVISAPNSPLSKEVNNMALYYVNKEDGKLLNKSSSFTSRLKDLLMKRWFF